MSHRSIVTTAKRAAMLAAVASTLASVVLFRTAAQSPPDQGAKDNNWIYYGGDARNWRYKPFDQVNASNFSNLQIAWRFRTDNLGSSLDYRLGATPIMANGVV